MVITVLPIIELLMIICAGFVFFRNCGNTFAEAISYAITTCLMVFSFIFQSVLIIGIPKLAVPIEILMVGLCLWIIFNYRKHLLDPWQFIREFIAFHPMVVAVCGIGFLYLFATAFIIPPVPSEWIELSRVIVYHQQHSIFVKSFNHPSLPLYPLNTDILSYLFIRMNTDIGVGLLGLIAYLSIGFSTYALSRRYSWPPMAFTVTIMVLSMPRLILLASSPSKEIISASVALFCILAITRSVEQPNIIDLILLILGIFFTISGKMTCLVFPTVLLALSCLILFRRHGTVAIGIMIKNHWKIVLATIPFVGIFSQLWLFIYNIIHFGTWLVQPPEFMRNSNELSGALANILRYLFESAHFTTPIQSFIQWAFGLDMLGGLQGLARRLLQVFFGNPELALEFKLQWQPDPKVSWFGPIGFFLIIPAIIFGVLRGQRRIKTISLGLLCYGLLISLIVAWQPGNASYFTLFYVCGGYITAFFLPPWRITLTGKRFIQTFCVLLFFYTCFFNYSKPLLTTSRLMFSNNIWVQTRWGTDRLSTAFSFFGDNRVRQCAQLIQPNSRVGIVFKDEGLIYPFAVALKQSDVILLPHSILQMSHSPSEGKTAISDLICKLDYLLAVDGLEKQLLNHENTQLVWHAPSMFTNIETFLIQWVRHK